MEQLKPCPFCGGKAMGPTDAWPHMITCERCGASVKGFNYAGAGAYEAITKWNKRTTDEIDPGYEIRRMGFDCITQNPVDEEDMRIKICERIANALSKSDALAIESAPYGPYHTMYRVRIRVAVPRRHVAPTTCGPDYCELERDHD